MTEITYPGILDRTKAVIMDTVFIILLMVAAKYIFSNFEEVPDSLRAGVFIFIWVVYDPLFTSVFGATIGHGANGICVRKASDQSKKIIFPLALLRYVVKTLLGWISLLTVSTSEKRLAIHDHLAGSIVLYKK